MELIRIQDDEPESPAITRRQRLTYLFEKARPVFADPQKTRQACQDLLEQIRGEPAKTPLEMFIDRQQATVPQMPEFPSGLCNMPKENKLARASRKAPCGKPATIPTVIPIMDHMKQSAVFGVVCVECFGKLAIGKLNL